MNTVVEQITDIQRPPVKVRPIGIAFNDLPPLPEESQVYAKTLDELQKPIKNDLQELLRDRFLCKGGGLLLVGPTGIGKSSLSMQMMINWAIGRDIFGIRPARPLKSLLIQSENDEGDMAEMRDGVFSGLNLAQDEIDQACSRIFVVHENKRTSQEFFAATLKPMLQAINPDLVWIDPALAYLGGENNSQEAVGGFLRNLLNPLLTEFNCGCVIVHHTNKPYNGPDRRGPVDSAYLGGGSAEWANWSRAILTLQKTKAPSVFELKAAKRGNRLGWKEADGKTTAFNRFIAHNKEPGTICWIEVEPTLIEGLGGDGKSDKDVLKHVPIGSPVSKNDLISLCADNGIGENATRGYIKTLVDTGKLFEWFKSRAGVKPEVYLARTPQPVDENGKRIFTTIFTPILSRENDREHQSEGSSHLHGPFRACDEDHEDHQDYDGRVASLPVSGSNACEEGPPPVPACLKEQLEKEPKR